MVCSVLRRAAPCLPGRGTHCLVNINAPSYLLRNITHNISVFSYIFPAHITHGNVTVARANHLAIHGTGCTRSFRPVRRNYRYCAYHGCSQTCVHRLFGTRRLLTCHLIDVRGLCFLLRFVQSVHRSVFSNAFHRFHGSF